VRRILLSAVLLASCVGPAPAPQGQAWVAIELTGPDSLLGTANGSRHGETVGDAGDVNGDGYRDLLVVAPGISAPESLEGRAFLHLGGPDGVEIAWTATMDGEQASAAASLDMAVAGLGDANGDGYDDFAVGWPSHDGAALDNGGIVRVFFGAASPNNVVDQTFEGAELEQMLGWAVAGPGDVDGDGLPDLLIGSPGWNGTFGDAGKAELFLANGTDFDAVPAWVFEGQANGESVGMSVAGAGDANGDGFADVIVGSPQSINRGQSWLMLGGAGGGTGLSVWAYSGPGSSDYATDLSGVGDVN